MDDRVRVSELSELFRCPRRLFLRNWGPDKVFHSSVDEMLLAEAARAAKESLYLRERGEELHELWERKKVRVSHGWVKAAAITAVLFLLGLMILAS